jgi:hypothetical protein
VKVTETRTLDLWLVRLEQTNHHPVAGDEEVLGWAEVYLYDRNEVTYCCELTPSYCLYALYTEVMLKDFGEGLSEEELSRLHEEHETSLDEYVRYVHCHDIQRLDDDPRRAYHIGEQMVEEGQTYEDVIEGYSEFYRGNHML